MTIATVYHRRESALHAGICSSPECDEITVDPTCRRCIHRLRLALVREVELDAEARCSPDRPTAPEAASAR
jgi:hypothetical protein